MHTQKIREHIHLIDVEPAGIENFIASYILNGKQTAIIETGPTSSIPNLLSGLKQLNVKPEKVAYIALSHIHLDHGGGTGTLLKHLPNAKVIVHQRGAQHLANPEKLWQQSQEILGKITELYGKPEPIPQERIIPAIDGMTFDVGNNVKLQVIETLGHASHHLSYHEPSSESLFPGDAAGIYLNKIDVIIPTTPPPFRLDIALASIDKLSRLKPKALFYTHFGQADKPLERLEAYAEQLKLWAKIARQGLDNKEDLQTIAERVRKNDAAIREAFEYIKVHPVLSETVLNESLLGVVGFVEKYGEVKP